MIKVFCSLLLIISTFSSNINAQVVSPFTLPAKWYFGNRGGIDFSGGTPSVLNDGRTGGWAQEGGSAITDPEGNVVFYTDGYRLYDGSHNFVLNVRGGTSSTQNSVAVPDPADPAKRFYLFTANVDPGGGGERVSASSELGINYYHIEKSGGTITVINGPVQIAVNNEVSEQLCVGTDNNGNYWIVSHEGGDWARWQMYNIYSWPVTANGVGARVSSNVTGSTGNNVWQGSLKINKCQTRLGAVYATGDVEVYEWDQESGKVRSLIRRITGFPALYGCEFSPDGNILYFTSHTNNRLYQLDISSGTVVSDTSWSSVNNVEWMGTLQLGPDGKIYVTNGNSPGSALGTPAYIGVVNDPDISGAGCNYDPKGFLLNSGPDIFPNIERGIANISWFAPTATILMNDQCPSFLLRCSVKNYFNQDVSLVAGSEEWDFGEGAGFEAGLGINPTHNFTRGGNLTVKLRFRDQACNKVWNISKNVDVACILPVTWLDIHVEKQDRQIVIHWSTASEINNDYFIIERSIDGVNFESIGSCKGGQSSDKMNHYKFIDEEPLVGNLYYRIKQVDFDGAYQFSPVVSLVNEEVDLCIYPNPSSDNFKLNSAGINEGIVEVFDLTGKEIFTAAFQYSLSFGSELPSGTYLVKVTSENSVLSRIVSKE